MGNNENKRIGGPVEKTSGWNSWDVEAGRDRITMMSPPLLLMLV